MFMIDLGAESYYSVLGVTPNATAAQIRQARDGLIRELRIRQRREPTRHGELDERQRVINAAGEELVHQRPVEVEPRLAGGARPLGLHAWPGDRESVRRQA